MCQTIVISNDDDWSGSRFMKVLLDVLYNLSLASKKLAF